MEIEIEKYSIYIKPGVTDMRKGFLSLALEIQNKMKLNPYSKSIFIFCGSNKRIIKALIWDKNGWIQITKRIMTREHFCWPKGEEEAREVGLEDILLMLKGNDPWRSFSSVNPKYV